MDRSHRHLTAQPTDFWLARGAILIIVLLQIGIVNDLAVGPRWLAPGLELAILIPLSLATAWTQTRPQSVEHVVRHWLLAIVALRGSNPSTRRFGNGVRHGEVVQLAKRLWLYSTYRRRQGRVRPHISAVERAGLRSLNEGQTVEYEIESNRGKDSAVNLKIK